MKVFEDRTVPARVLKVCVHRQCDLCGASTNKGTWNKKVSLVSETECKIEVRSKEGDLHEGGYGVEIDVDICPKCFIEKLVPWLKSQGAAINAEAYYGR